MFDVKNNQWNSLKFSTKSLSVLIFLLLCRMLSMWLIPLNDSTEARYGEIARKMLETGNWVTLQHDYGVPFWAKPPLSTWLSAMSMGAFGVNEFAVRLPGLLLSFGILWLVWFLAKKHSGSVVAMVATLVLASSLYFFLGAGTVMTDPALIFCTTLSMVAFWRAFVDGQKIWSYVFFVGLGLGLLAKGPLAIVLVGMPVFFWILFRNEWALLWQRLPWVSGTLLCAAIALPWYILAELRTPGFLNYFIVGEHLQRFLTPGWTGDKYGLAHHAHWGMIWIYAIAGIFPWSILGLCWLVTSWKKLPSLSHDDDGWMSYLLFFMLLPLCFFTFASNIIYPYVFPSLPAFALFFAEMWRRSTPSLGSWRWILRASVISGIFFLVATVAFQIMPETVAKTQKPLIEAWLKENPAAGSQLMYWAYKPENSAQFYSAGRVISTKDLTVLSPWLRTNTKHYLVVNSKELTEIPADLQARSTVVTKIWFKQNLMLLLLFPAIRN